MQHVSVVGQGRCPEMDDVHIGKGRGYGEKIVQSTRLSQKQVGLVLCSKDACLNKRDNEVEPLENDKARM